MEKPIIFPIMKHSDEAEEGAEELIRDIKSGTLRCPVDPFLNNNIFSEMLISAEERSYSDFLQSNIGRKILNAIDSEMEKGISK